MANISSCIIRNPRNKEYNIDCLLLLSTAVQLMRPMVATKMRIQVLLEGRLASATRFHKARKGHTIFDERFKDLMAFKEEFGHCNVPQTQSRSNKYYSLGTWCCNIRKSFKAIKEGKLSKPDIKRLENAGFQWSLNETFDERFKDVKHSPAIIRHYSLALWCNNIRQCHTKAIKEGGRLSKVEGRNPGYKLSKADIQRLENAGFEWNLCKKFDERFKDLMAFKAEYGYCNVSATRSRHNNHLSLGRWCSDIRRSYKTIKGEGGLPKHRLSKADIQRFENAGFEWNK